MKRLGLLIAAGMLLALLPASAASGGSGETADVTVLHGLGPAPNTVDVYLGEEDATEWELIIEDFEYGDLEDLGAIDPAVYNVLLCSGGDSTTPINGCTDAMGVAVNGNFGTNVEVAPGSDTTLVAAYDQRPTVLAFENDIDCLDPGQARLTANHAATLGPVNVLADGTEVFADLEFAGSEVTEVEAGEYDVEVELASDDSPVVGTTVQLDALTATVLYVVGDIDGQIAYDILGIDIEVPECQQPTTTVVPATPVTPAPVAAPVAVTPAFTG